MGAIVGHHFATLHELYAVIPAIRCQGKCHDSCGPIGASELELQVARHAGYDLLEATLRWLSLEHGPDVPIPMCSALDENKRCAIYDKRPTICRVWGVSEEMPCTHGCVPDVVLTEDESSWIVQESIRLGGPAKLAPFSLEWEAGYGEVLD